MEQLVDTPVAAMASPSAAPAERRFVVLAYAVTIFASAFLLFQVQPLISKFILPWFGGSPAVWTAAMLFFQMALFGGYLYAHLTSTYLRSRAQFVLHVSLLAAAAALTLITRIAPSQALKPAGDEASPLLQIMLVLGASVGLPYFALASTGPLLQKWFSDAFAGVSPYRLFALSNVGSLLALLTYPFFFEVHWDSTEQATMWSLGFLVFAAFCAFCAWWTFRARQTASGKSAARPAAAAANVARQTAEESDAPPGVGRRAAWILLPALASIMFLAVTNEVCQNVATVPLLWIIPLSLYLVSFIVAFDHPRWYIRPVWTLAAIGLIVYLANFDEFTETLNEAANRVLGRSDADAIDWNTWTVQCGVYFTALLAICLVCHCELARLRPSPRRLTGYFLSMSLGGAVGGLFVNLVAPYWFDTFFELPLGFLAAIAVAGGALGMWLLPRSKPAAIGVVPLAGLAMLGVGYGLIDLPQSPDPAASRATLYRGRNFFGLVTVQHRSRNDSEWENYTFLSGHIAHGRQFADPAKRDNTYLAYWGPRTGCRRALEYKVAQEPHCRIGVIGLGIGTIASFAKKGDYCRFYEINPEVIDIADRYFHFLRDCPAEKEIVVGDARLQLERELRESGGRGHQFDVLCLDAFSGDAVPTHLLTTEAFAVYKQHLKPDGIIVAHITNTYLDLYPVVRKLAEEHSFAHTRIYRPSDLDRLVYRTYFVLVTNDQDFLQATPEELIEMPESFRVHREVPLWTDRYHNLFQVLR